MGGIIIFCIRPLFRIGPWPANKILLIKLAFFSLLTPGIVSSWVFLSFFFVRCCKTFVFLLIIRFTSLRLYVPYEGWFRDSGLYRVTIITKTCLYNFDPLKPHFYIVKLGFTGVYIIFLFLLKNIDCGYSLEPPQSMFRQKILKISDFFLSENFEFLEVKFSIYMNRRVFVMCLNFF